MIGYFLLGLIVGFIFGLAEGKTNAKPTKLNNTQLWDTWQKGYTEGRKSITNPDLRNLS